ncbi:MULTISPECIES: NUDIX hydrolase [Streptomyces]|uniref:NUDIX domain protein n=1 Tax=Streptomyces fradiae ATCC 10745 = DSM 40063 TaxID=1319510 RepID=A0A1Y2NN98_STRFR|nr:MULTISPECIES: NUDIX hydrolase [Streptomyces]KAF0650870.1 NUDIX hydrolase [Streptomyces fradiae ATCC 10745 = DSM 40063]OSY48701.1 NUDIX domain protein [Streptomyces fradiae ATCC 10745 = DSM 40063]
MSNGQWYPPEWPDRIRALAAGELTAVAPRRAATVMLLRAAGDATEVHMLRRRASMAFAGGAYAYPGGGVDPRDEQPVRWAGPAPAEWAERLGVATEAEARAIVCAAVRETFEEAGVLLAGPTADSVVDDTTGDDWEAARAALVARELSFAEFLDGRDLVLRSDLLGAWARWITPEFEPRRYDTWFFVAALPTGQRASNASTEADRTVWIRPADAAAGYDRGELLMMPPTIATLRALTAYGSPLAALAAAGDQDLAPVLARARLDGDRVVLSWPGHDEFTKHVPGAPGESTGAVASGRTTGTGAAAPASGTAPGAVPASGAASGTAPDAAPASAGGAV